METKYMNEKLNKIIKKLNKGKDSLGERDYLDTIEELEKGILALLKEKIDESPDVDYTAQLEETLEGCKIEEKEIESIRSNLSSILALYADFVVLNTMQEKAIIFLQECTQRFVVFSDFDFTKEYTRFGFEDANQMHQVCSAVRSVFYSQVAGRIAPLFAESQVKELFGFNETIASTYRNLYELNYDRITMNVTMSRLKPI